MSEFKREERFIVIKRKHLSAESRFHESLEQELRVWLDKHLIPTSECVVVESDWPEYETVWSMIAARVEGRPTPYQVIEQQVAALRQHKNDYMEAAEETRRALETEAQALREEVARSNRITIAMALDIAAVGEVLGIPAEEQEGGTGELIDLIRELQEEVAALRARVVVVPGRITHTGVPYAPGWNACLDELARLNGKAVSEGLLRRLAVHKPGYDDDHYAAVEELRDLLDERKESGDVLVRE
ncbi:hypothetical protein [Pseudomonas nitroreducens]|uniref:Uncharacterized protein n=1 Tax=Pseudomonas nitroreducens TaxID=46680 RepID=A0A6G6IV28_PSENT|nr:hypothetical protein [Pseudomonas nitroreducens]QIE86958.1 hypothetical protein G5B91_12050 [Pseudomonas nitroreducens]